MAYLRLLAVFGAVAVAANFYVEPKDREAATEASSAKTTFCTDGSKGDIDKDLGRAALEQGVGGDNIVEKALMASNSPSQVTIELRERMTVSWLITKVLPLAMAPIMMLCWCCCCWSACCKCCRCCAKERRKSPVLKCMIVFVLLMLFLCIVAVAVISMRGFQSASDGVDNMSCVAATMIDTTLSGQTNPKFIGMIPLLDTFATMSSVLDDNSQFLQDINIVMASTEKITQATTVASGTMKLLRDMMQVSANQQPTLTSGQDSLHKCYFCAEVPSMLDPAISALDNGVGVALANARAQVDEQLSSQKRQDLQQTLRQTTDPLVQVKDLVRDSFKPFISQTDGFKDVKNQMPSGLGACLAIVITALMLLCCGCSGGGMFVLSERDKKAAANGENPHKKPIQGIACCAWCCGFYYAVLAFFVGGFFVFITVPLSAGCLMLDNLSGDTIRNIGPAVNFDVTGTQGTMLVGIIDQCFGKDAAEVNPPLLDLIYTMENNTKVTMREKVVGQVKDKLLTKFDDITQKLNSVPSPDLANSSEIGLLRETLRNNSMEAMLIADQQRMAQNADYQGLGADSRNENGVAIGFSTSCTCTDTVVGSGMGALSGQTVPGINTFVDKLKAFGTEIPDASGTCASTVLCSPGLSLEDSTACTAGNRYSQLKRDILSTGTFRCDLFERQDGSTCDPKFMTQTGSVWNNDCLRSDGTLKVKQITCNLAAFSQYVNEFDGRINKVFMRLDSTVGDTLTKVNVDVRNLVNQAILEPIDNVASGITCGFFGANYRGMVDGFCYQGVVGFRTIGWSYVACGGMAVIFIALMYTLWRRVLDNRTFWSGENNLMRNPQAVNVEGVGKGNVLKEGDGVSSV